MRALLTIGKIGKRFQENETRQRYRTARILEVAGLVPTTPFRGAKGDKDRVGWDEQRESHRRHLVGLAALVPPYSFARQVTTWRSAGTRRQSLPTWRRPGGRACGSAR